MLSASMPIRSFSERFCLIQPDSRLWSVNIKESHPTWTLEEAIFEKNGGINGRK